MRRVLTLYAVVTCLAFGWELSSFAQPPVPKGGGGPVPNTLQPGNGPFNPRPGLGLMPTSVGFRNETKNAIVVQGFTVVKGIERRGQPVLLPPNRSNFDMNVPMGIRVYSVYDANQPANILLREFPIPIKGNDLLFSIKSQGANKVQFVPVSP